jgi:mono/diheme cytochrome c family protein
MKHVLLLLSLFSATSLAQQPVSKDKALDLAGNIHVIFEHKCNECHGSQLKKPEGKFGYVLDLKRMADNEDYVIRGKPQKSELFRLVNEGEMPPDDHPKTPPLTGEEKDIVRRWIQAGAPHELPAVLPKRTFTSPAPAKAKSPKDIRITLDARDQPAAQLLTEIAKQAHIEIAYTAPKNEPKLSITFKNGPLNEALDYLVLCGNLTLRWEGEKAIIAPAKP